MKIHYIGTIYILYYILNYAYIAMRIYTIHRYAKRKNPTHQQEATKTFCHFWNIIFAWIQGKIEWYKSTRRQEEAFGHYIYTISHIFTHILTNKKKMCVVYSGMLYDGYNNVDCHIEFILSYIWIFGNLMKKKIYQKYILDWNQRVAYLISKEIFTYLQ